MRTYTDANAPVSLLFSLTTALANSFQSSTSNNDILK